VRPIWRPIAGFPGYRVSRGGHVRRGRLALLPQWRGGYLRVRLVSPDGRRVWRPVHALVLEAFVAPRPSTRHHGAHFPDRDRGNNRAGNLRWALPEENEADKRVHGTHPRGGPRKATGDSVVAAIRESAQAGESFTAIGRRLGLHRTSVARIVAGTRRRSG
jgi:hypothetical protein